MFAIFRRPLFWLVVLGLLALGGTGLVMSNQAKAKKAAETAAKPVDSPYAAIAAGKIDVEGGVIQVAARTAGVVREVYVQEGQEVKKGEILARLEDDELRLSAEQQRAVVRAGNNEWHGQRLQHLHWLRLDQLQAKVRPHASAQHFGAPQCCRAF